MSVMILDAGNSIIKAKITQREQEEIAFPHAIKQLTEADYTNVVSWAGVAGPPAGYLRINDLPYVVGESAERHGVHVQRTGAACYTRDYLWHLRCVCSGKAIRAGRGNYGLW